MSTHLRAPVLWSLLLAVTGCAARPQYTHWSEGIARDHPLVGRIWDSQHGTWLRTGDLLREVIGTPVLLLGETHDQVDHHRIQAELLGAWLEAHPKGAVAFEQLDESQGEELASAALETPEDVRRASHWDESGWPAFEMYAPVFEVALSSERGPIAAHPDTSTVRAVMLGGDVSADLKLDPPPDERALSQLNAQIQESHCGHAPSEMVRQMVLAQRLKDGWMARTMATAGTEKVALIAGSGTVRRDWGVHL